MKNKQRPLKLLLTAFNMTEDRLRSMKQKKKDLNHSETCAPSAKPLDTFAIALDKKINNFASFDMDHAIRSR